MENQKIQLKKFERHSSKERLTLVKTKWITNAIECDLARNHTIMKLCSASNKRPNRRYYNITNQHFNQICTDMVPTTNCTYMIQSNTCMISKAVEIKCFQQAYMPLIWTKAAEKQRRRESHLTKVLNGKGEMLAKFRDASWTLTVRRWGRSIGC